jgi:hypothetical protein
MSATVTLVYSVIGPRTLQMFINGHCWHCKITRSNRKFNASHVNDHLFHRRKVMVQSLDLSKRTSHLVLTLDTIYNQWMNTPHIIRWSLTSDGMQLVAIPRYTCRPLLTNLEASIALQANERMTAESRVAVRECDTRALLCYISRQLNCISVLMQKLITELAACK